MQINTCFLIPVISELKVKLIFNKYEMNSYYQQQKYPTIAKLNSNFNFNYNWVEYSINFVFFLTTTRPPGQVVKLQLLHQF